MPTRSGLRSAPQPVDRSCRAGIPRARDRQTGPRRSVGRDLSTQPRSAPDKRRFPSTRRAQSVVARRFSTRLSITDSHCRARSRRRRRRRQRRRRRRRHRPRRPHSNASSPSTTATSSSLSVRPGRSLSRRRSTPHLASGAGIVDTRTDRRGRSWFSRRTRLRRAGRSRRPRRSRSARGRSPRNA